ncbi:RIP metalloprotease RseP [Aestuariivirga sp.]|uniref:RIP metalloprotease RseP n=1 Tax=Aestuariivirga sp. TaxID=2650926 RepID=UPI0039E49EAF
MELSSLVNLPFGYILPFLVAITVIVFVHEFGHFQVARWCGVKVEAFSIGFGREIFGWFDKHGTRWKICWLPLGGYVRFEGDANAASMPGEVAPDAARGPGNFHSKAIWQRALIVAAGPIANFILAIFIFTAAYSVIGVPYAEPRVDEVLPGSAAEEAGLMKGDYIRKVEGRETKSFASVQEIVWQKGGVPLAIVVDRGGQEIDLTLTPRLQEVPDGFGGNIRIGLLGVKHDPATDTPLFERYSLPQAFLKGVERTWYIIATTGNYVAKLFTGNESINQIGGPIAMAKGAGDTASSGGLAFISFVALLSVSIGLINLFPVPMLDGGHLVFYAVEALRGKPLGPNAQEWGYRIGFSFVVMLMLIGIWNDVVRTISVVLGS